MSESGGHSQTCFAIQIPLFRSGEDNTVTVCECEWGMMYDGWLMVDDVWWMMGDEL